MCYKQLSIYKLSIHKIKWKKNEVPNNHFVPILWKVQFWKISLFLLTLFSDYEHVSSSSEYHPFNAQGYDIPRPEVALVYGFPNISPLQSSPHFYPESSPTETNLFDTPTTTDTAIYDNDSTTILTGDSLNSRKKRSLFHSQPKVIKTPTTTARPRTQYNDEGRWRIIRQEENKQEKKYDYL